MRGYKWIVSPCSFGKVLASGVVYFVFEENLMVGAFRFLNQNVHGDKNWKLLTERSWILDGFHNLHGFSNHHWKNCNTYLFPARYLLLHLWRSDDRYIYPAALAAVSNKVVAPTTVAAADEAVRRWTGVFGLDPPKLIGDSKTQLLHEHALVKNRF